MYFKSPLWICILVVSVVMYSICVQKCGTNDETVTTPTQISSQSLPLFRKFQWIRKVFVTLTPLILPNNLTSVKHQYKSILVLFSLLVTWNENRVQRLYSLTVTFKGQCAAFSNEIQYPITCYAASHSVQHSHSLDYILHCLQARIGKHIRKKMHCILPINWAPSSRSQNLFCKCCRNRPAGR